MKEFDFELIFQLANSEEDASKYTDALFENGCDDATISTGQLGMVYLSFTREANNADEAVKSAINDVKKAIPLAKLVEVGLFNILCQHQVIPHQNVKTTLSKILFHLNTYHSTLHTLTY